MDAGVHLTQSILEHQLLAWDTYFMRNSDTRHKHTVYVPLRGWTMNDNMKA